MANKPERVQASWVAGAAAASIGLVLALLFHFPAFATTIAALLFGGAFLFQLPDGARRLRFVLLNAFLFAQLTSIFITPFTWLMRFAFATTLIGAAVFLVATRGD